MDQQWLDSLSEDWISQPRSSPPASLPSSTPSDASIASQKSQSRIPRYKQRRSSASVDCSNIARAAAISPKFAEGASKALNERSLSDLNIDNGHAAGKKAKEERDWTSSRRGRKLSRTVSSTTAKSTEHHTIHYKSVSCSPEKSRRNYETPEWKRRLIRGQVAYGEQRDLFGPSGLESIFQPPAPRQEQQTRGKKRGAQKIIFQEEIPSSPPLYQPMTQQSRTSVTRLQTNQGVETTTLAVLTEEEEVNEAIAGSDGTPLVWQRTEPNKDYGQDDLGSNLVGSISFDHIATSTLPRDHGGERASLFDRHLQRVSESKEQANLAANHAGSKGSTIVDNPMKEPHAKTRTASGLEEERNEGISPIFVSRQNTIDGRIDYAALNESMDQMGNELRNPNIRRNERMNSGTNDPPPESKATHSRSASPIIHSDEWTSQSLPGNLTTGTQEFVSRGGYVNVRRGGYSNDGSFQRRNLSPSSMPSPLKSDQTDVLSTNGERPRRGSWPCISEDDTPLPAAPTPPSLFKTPTKQQGYQTSTPEKSKSSGSPLKLFGAYDTFTNERLLRRMSQFESCSPCEEEEVDQPHGRKSGYETTSQSVNVQPALKAALDGPLMPNVMREHSQQALRLSSFGDGQLNGYEFEECSYTTGFLDNQEGSLASLGRSFPKSPTHQYRKQPQHRKARNASSSTSSIRSRKTVEVRMCRTRPTPTKVTNATEAQKDSTSVSPTMSLETESKRPLTSPVKDPTPKRRRTLQKSEIVVGTAVYSQSITATHNEMQKVIGMKRKDARYGTSQSVASPDVIASRRILHPKTSALSQSRAGTIDQSDKNADASRILSSNIAEEERPPKSQAEHLASEVGIQAEAVAEELAAFRVSVGEHLVKGNRKQSYTTQDYLDEAVKIMDIIRAKGRPQSGLASVEESESENREHEAIYEDAVIDDSDLSKESFTRPPSREGLSVSKPRREARQDPRVLSHLRKFEEREDANDILLSSVKSLHISKQAQPTEPPVIIELEDFESQPPNIRIHQKRKHTDVSSPVTSAQLPEIHIHSQSSQSLSYPSSGRTIPTGSSTSSNTKHIIAPDKVSHLIPPQVAGMTYDATKRAWIKRKDRNTAQRESGEKSMSEESEQDPFGDIPDLTVDDMEELRRISDIIARRAEREMSVSPIDVKDMASQETRDRPNQVNEENILISQSQTVGKRTEDPAESGFTASRISLLRASGPKTETRATTRSEEDMKSMERRKPDVQAHPGEGETVDIEHEIGIHEGRSSQAPAHSISRTRNITIAFSSPVVSHVQQHKMLDSPQSAELWSDRSQIEIEDSIVENIKEAEEPGSHRRSGSRRTSAVLPSSSTYRGAARKFSLGGRGFTPRAVSRIEERIEETVDFPFRTSHNRSLDVTVSTPLPRRALHPTNTGPTTSVNRTSHVSFHLSPLPDFTMNESGTPLQKGCVLKRRSSSLRKEIDHSYALATQDLVRKITDVEPYEPYWEHIRQLDLSNQRLDTLHVLNQFCGALEELDVSDNDISQLGGVPSSVRTLKIQRNCLSGMTAWNHLSNLQYLDISGNEVESLEGFRDLVHLRELRADDNKITSLEGVLDLDGLLSLKIRRNLLVTVDFEATELKRLTDLDLTGNELSEVKNLHHLPSLVHLGLDNNEIHTLAVDNPFFLPTLRSLKLTNNQLENLNVSPMPNLRVLYADRNKLTNIDGIQCAKYLDSVSMREQSPATTGQGLNSTTSECHEIRKLYISGNITPFFAPKTDYLNLQYLELASSGLESLSLDFGHMMPNVRVLNLNFNALSDIRPLLGIRRLKKLLLAGNRLNRLRRTTAILSRFDSLTKLDLRSNPLTLGFYPPLTETRLVVREGPNSGTIFFEPFTLPDADREVDHAYANRLDQGTKLRRRVYEMLFACGCKRLRSLDGLGFDGEDVLRRDGIWEKLAALGVVRDSTGMVEREATGVEEDKPLLVGEQIQVEG